jgi:hypothetical protein
METEIKEVRVRFIIYIGDSFHRNVIYQIGVMEIQSCYRHHQQRVYLYNLEHPAAPPMPLLTLNAYARAIQLAWRAFCNVRVYRYFKDLVLNKLRGAPSDLLRAIIPREVDFMDRAAGVHVRFRLGGSIFPPKIYYKIFTHRPLCDVNAFAPRNYTLERQVDPVSLHNKVTGKTYSAAGLSTNVVMQKTHMRVGGAYFDAVLSNPVDQQGWYERKDSNPWRVIAAGLEEVFEPPPWTALDQNIRTTVSAGQVPKYSRKSRKNPSSHFSTLRRKQDVLLEKKRRKREWMLKAYMLTAGSKGMKGGSEAKWDHDDPEETLQQGSALEGEAAEKERADSSLPQMKGTLVLVEGERCMLCMIFTIP